MSKEYIALMKQWCEDILESYNGSLDELREHIESNTLVEWKRKVIQFQDELTDKENMVPTDLFERANELYSELQQYFERSKNRDEEEGSRIQMSSGTVPIGMHTLPPLPYSYDALEPYINQEIMKLHHDKHHKSYVDGLNKAEKEMQKARMTNNFELIKHWEREAAFHGAGHYLHTIFWSIMSPNGGGQPSGMLIREINQSFGNFQNFKSHFSEAANQVEGVGWAILVWSPRSRRLEILQAEKHQNLSQWDVVPILVLDVWEHAYYLQYKNNRKKYIENWWNIVNWREVERRFHEAQQLKWKPY
ncbi:superoxide dismutase [uncultured Metabacillus sp.]|uniref:superoxide dismutase n=1 Tax=uncultured Metabacillus sp. TaxID=2860135 RepID=UPI002610D4E7|nr:superoxide dismutase [uncultured Metabacillus sp.]